MKGKREPLPTAPVRDSAADAPATRERTRTLTPAVDIHEQDDALVVIADVPGLVRENLAIDVTDNVLTINGRIARTETGNIIAREFELNDYFRQFTLGDRIDRDRITANLEQGVLTINLPYAATARPRRIEIK
jgi:HSP20 family protein